MSHHKDKKKSLKEFFEHYSEELTEMDALMLIKKKMKCIKKALKEGRDYSEYLADIHNMAEKWYKELKGL